MDTKEIIDERIRKLNKKILKLVDIKESLEKQLHNVDSQISHLATTVSELKNILDSINETK